jgi:hypothetical protein
VLEISLHKLLPKKAKKGRGDERGKDQNKAQSKKDNPTVIRRTLRIRTRHELPSTLRILLSETTTYHFGITYVSAAEHVPIKYAKSRWNEFLLLEYAWETIIYVPETVSSIWNKWYIVITCSEGSECQTSHFENVSETRRAAHCRSGCSSPFYT